MIRVIQRFMYILFMLYTLNPFTVFVVSGCFLSQYNELHALTSLIGSGLYWRYIWMNIRLHFYKIDSECLDILNAIK